MLNFSYESDAPASDDVYEIAVTGFTQRLSFRMIPCIDYEDIKQIGPTALQNGISVTTTAHRIDDKLIVWLYPFRVSGAGKDRIIGYGQSINGSFVKERFIETESGRITTNHSGWSLSERLIFDMNESDTNATLHIPYLTMYREERGRLRANLPNSYTTISSDVSVKTTLGMINVREISREACEHDSTKDVVRLYFDFVSNDENMTLYSFDYDLTGFKGYSNFDGESGKREYLAVYVGKNDSRVSLNITGLYYYLFGEYVIPLDIQ
jgi:hypothetical protein